MKRGRVALTGTRKPGSNWTRRVTTATQTEATTNGNTEAAFCGAIPSRQADPHIAHQGNLPREACGCVSDRRVGTQVLGYDNRLVSECLDGLRPGDELPWSSDESYVRDAEATADEVLAAEDEARRILSQNRTVHLTLAQALAAKGELGKDEVLAIIGGRKPRYRRKASS